MTTFLLFVIALPILFVLAVIVLHLFIEALPWTLIVAAGVGVLLGIGYAIEALPDEAQNLLEVTAIGAVAAVILGVPAILVGVPVIATIADIIKTIRRKSRS